MCGFVGFVSLRKDKKEIIERMKNTIIHRGPDSEGTYLDDHIAMGFRRLSIIDLEKATQPLTSIDGRYVITFNGEIYNYLDLREELKRDFHTVFKTDSDTETIIEVYKHYGSQTASKLRGMFAFVIYDKVKHTLYGARDYFGIKPFYYTFINNDFVYGSEYKAFLEYPDFHKEVNVDALNLYLTFQYNPLDEAMLKHVYSLKPGHSFTYIDGKFEVNPYFEINYKSQVYTEEKAMKQIAKTVKQSVDYHQISDVEVGAFLSGGVDSSYIASQVKTMNTYSVGFKEKGFDEVIYAKELCQKLGFNNYNDYITPDAFFDKLPEIAYYSDEPHANLSAAALYFLAKLASKDVKVVLSGEGADELFGGYSTYQDTKHAILYKKIPFSIRKIIKKLVPKTSKYHDFVVLNGSKIEDTYIGQAKIFDKEEALSILTPQYQSSITSKQVTKPYFDKAEALGLDEFHKKLYVDMHLWLPKDILLKADKMTMAHSLELRVPYLDKEVFKLASSLPTHLCLKDRISKYIFRKTAMSFIPMDSAKRKKLGFMVPFKNWLYEDKYYQKVRNTFTKDYVKQFFDQEKILKYLDDHYHHQGLYQRKIYTIYMFLLWYEQYFILH